MKRDGRLSCRGGHEWLSGAKLQNGVGEMDAELLGCPGGCDLGTC